MIKLLLLLSFNITAQPVIISEVVTDNKTFSDQFGKTPDWLELYNNSTETICLGSYKIADENDLSKAWNLPDTCIPTKQYFLLFLSGQSAINHAPFSLKHFKEKLYLFHNNVVIDSSVGCIPTNHSYGRLLSDQNYYHFTNPTPGSTNDASSKKTITLFYDTLISNTPSGFYNSSIQFDLQTTRGISIFYTLDGSHPDVTANIYNHEIILNQTMLPDDVLSQKKTADTWERPENDVFNGFAIRAIGFTQGCPVTNEINATFFISSEGSSRYPVPVVSISTEPDDFFSKKDGIYVIGEGIEPNFIQRGKDWERDIHLEFIVNNQTVLKQNVEASIHGRYTRYKPQKSIRIETKKNATINYPFFGEAYVKNFSSITLHTVDKHASSSFFKDELISVVLNDLDLGTMNYRPVVVFINGEYWGVHNIRERQDEDFAASHYNVNADEVIMSEEPILSDGSEFSNFVISTSLLDLKTNENYTFISEQIDLNNLIDYMIANMYFSNYDWPHNNIRVWKSKDPASKWRFMFYDCDVCMTKPDQDFLFKVFTTKYPNEPASLLFEKLFENEQFKMMFYKRFLYHISNTFKPEKILSRIDNMEKIYAPLVPEHIARWHFPPSFDAWNSNVTQMKTFTVQRAGYMLEQLVTYLGNPLKVYPNPANDQFNISLMSNTSYLVNMYDARGNLVLQRTGTDATPFYTAGFAKGLYLVEVRVDDFIYTTKLIVE